MASTAGRDAGATLPVGAGAIDVTGSLFRAGDNPAGAMGGIFRISDDATNGHNYRAIGSFVGE